MKDCTLSNYFSKLPILLKFLQGTKFNCEQAYTDFTKQLKRVEEEPPIKMTPDIIAGLVKALNKLRPQVLCECVVVISIIGQFFMSSQNLQLPM